MEPVPLKDRMISNSQDLDAYYDGKEIDYSLTEEKAAADPEYEKVDSGYAVVRADGDAYKLEHLE